MVNSWKPEPFVVSPDDPLEIEHAAVAAWVEDAFGALGESYYYQDLDFKTISSGEILVGGNPEQSRRFVIAAVAQVKHWDRLTAQVRAQASNEMERINAHLLPGWGSVWGRRRMAELVVSTLMRRSLPFDKVDLLALLEWCGIYDDSLSTYFAPIGHLTRALQRYVSTNGADCALREAMRQFVALLRSSHDKEAKRFATTLDQLCVDGPSEVATECDVPAQSTPQPAPAGSNNVLDQLKRMLGMLPNDPLPGTTVIAPDAFVCRDDSPLRHEHEMLSALFNEVIGTSGYYRPDLKNCKAGRRLMELKPAAIGRALLGAAERHVNALVPYLLDLGDNCVWQSRYAASGVAGQIIDTDFELDRAGTFDLLLYLAVLPPYQRAGMVNAAAKLIATAVHEATTSPLTEGERFVLSLFRASLISGPPVGNPSDEVKALTRLINDGASFYLVPGEAWSDLVNEELPILEVSQRSQWSALLLHALSATASRPSAKWLKTAKHLIQAIGEDQVRESLMRWFLLVKQGQTIRRLGNYAGDARGASDTMNDENATCLRGLLWCVPLLPGSGDMVRRVTAVALSAYKKVPGVGPRAVKVGNAAVYALSKLGSKEAVGHLAMLKVRVRFGTAQKEIEKAFDAAATALDLPRDEIEELGVPSCGLEEVGRRCEEIGGYRAELVVAGSNAKLTWSDTSGKPLKSVPTKVKSQHNEELKELQQSLKDIQSMLPAQRDRIDGLFLVQKSWPITDWRERYHDHPLVGTIARRLLWCVDGVSAFFINGTPTDVRGEIITHGRTAEVTLWHPVGRSIEEITTWRGRLEELAITQPFKQAYREVYLLTDAERNTRTYSNRFAAHVIRQHQFNALCAARGWRNKLRLMVDDYFPPASKEVPQAGLRAEFWVEGIGQDYGVDTNDSGSYLRLATDQVRFYRIGAAESYAHAGGGGYGSQAAGPGEGNVNEPFQLDEVPPLVFSEIMRDVDLFVGVASVGNDPTWQDGGPQGRYRDYWQSYSFGELSTTAATRKQVLERLVPRLKIAKQCSFSDRFLIVRGKMRTYKIHLGSGNILMAPNDQYLCIVPDARERASGDNVYLPFEGDATLSIIISKALLLAEDTKIKDPSIIGQIKGV